MASTGCRTVERTVTEYVEVPVLAADPGMPVLENYPSIDTSILVEQSKGEVAAVLGAYNRNMIRLMAYAMRLGGYSEASQEYKDRIISILNSIED